MSIDPSASRFCTFGASGGLSPGVPGVAVDGLVGQSPQMLAVTCRMEKAAPTAVSICVYGESGTGKELVARAIHDLSPRRDRPFVTLDCTAVPEGLIESHIFGHVKGAFTGATEYHEGVFTLAHTGTLFIDELTELSLPLQAKLLRVVQTRECMKVGGTKPVRCDVRLITAMSHDPREAVKEGTLRNDLYYRVAVVMIRMPPLRERREDIPFLVRHFTHAFSQQYRKPIRTVAPGALGRLVGAPWPGNVRQLEHVIEQAIVLAEGDVLTELDLFGDEDSGSSVDIESGLSLSELERRHILRTLKGARGNRRAAASLLGISLRSLQYKLKALQDGTRQRLHQPATAERTSTATSRTEGAGR